MFRLTLPFSFSGCLVLYLLYHKNLGTWTQSVNNRGKSIHMRPVKMCVWHTQKTILYSENEWKCDKSIDIDNASEWECWHSRNSDWTDTTNGYIGPMAIRWQLQAMMFESSKPSNRFHSVVFAFLFGILSFSSFVFSSTFMSAYS